MRVVHKQPLADYLRDADGPRLSASIAHLLISRSPMHAWHAHPALNPLWKPAENDEFDYGRVAHAILLENSEAGLHVVDAPDWRTKLAREEREKARALGKTPVLLRQLERIRAMVSACRAALGNSELGISLEGGFAETSVYWEEGDVRLKARFDWFSDIRRLIIDYKTVENAEPNSFMRSALGFGYDLQEALYRRAGRLICGEDVTFVFVAQEKEPPFACSLVAFDPAMQEYAERRLSYAIALWQRCLTSGRWRGYANRIAWVGPPPWYISETEEMMEEEDGIHSAASQA